MGATTGEMFGAQAGEPATPGSYGRRPAGFRLPEETRLGRVVLQVADLERSIGFYVDGLGLRVARRGEGSAELAAHGDERVLVELRERAGARLAGKRGQLGLYHFAILLPDRPSLARFVRHLAEAGIPAGAGDHLVSEAFYLQDPDGLGIEVYADRPRSTWRRSGDELMISTDPVDVQDLLRAADGPWTGMPAGTTIGHVHLHVGGLEEADAFYAEKVGFDRISWRYPGALFLGAGGYHHHLGTNTWAGPAARPPAEGDARLLEWTIEIPAASLDAAAASLGAQVARDPWGTQLRLATF